MSKQKSTWMQRFAVKVKVKAPVGIRLTSGETLALADIYDKDVEVMRKNKKEVEQAVLSTKPKDTGAAIGLAMEGKNRASAVYRRTQDPIKKREWARRVVVADHTLKSMRAMQKRMSVTHDRLTMIKGDIELQLMEAEARAAEARAYAQAGKQLRLAGEKLIDARARAKNVKLEYTNLEVTMEGAERAINSDDADKLLKKADKLSGLVNE